MTPRLGSRREAPKEIDEILGVTLPTKRAHKHGAFAWCARCSRFHFRRKACDLYLRDRRTRGRKIGDIFSPGKMVKRWAH